MRAHTLSHVSDAALLRGLATLVAHDRRITAALLAHLAEVDARRLYLPAGHPSMLAYCVEALHFSESAAFKRIQAARVAHEHPRLLRAVADGRLHLTAVCMLSAHLTVENAEELESAATHRSRAELAPWLAERFAPAPTLLPLETCAQLAPERVEQATDPAGVARPASPPGPIATPPGCGELAPERVESPPAPWPAAQAKSMLHIAITRRTRDKLRRAQALLGHEMASGDPAVVIDRALDALIARLEKRQAAAESRPRRTATPSSEPRAVPAHIKRAVWKRDAGRCAFVARDGRRCAARKRLEFDHIHPVARGGRASTEGMRLLCRAHNQFEAERVFGKDLMDTRRRHGVTVHEGRARGRPPASD